MRPSAAVSRTSVRNVSWTSGSSPLVGSSSTARLGRCMNAWIRPIFCRLPLERSRTGRSSCAAQAVGQRRDLALVAAAAQRAKRRQLRAAGRPRPQAQVAGQVADRPRARRRRSPGCPGPAARPGRRSAGSGRAGCGSACSCPRRWGPGIRTPRPARRAGRRPQRLHLSAVRLGEAGRLDRGRPRAHRPVACHVVRDTVFSTLSALAGVPLAERRRGRDRRAAAGAAAHARRAHG